jgi:hypothetical protein
MSQDLGEKYVYFKVGLLKNSFGLEALWQDALKYHMIDQPGKLIAFRLTEYYEMMARGVLHPGPSVSIAAMPPATGNGGSREGMTAASSPGLNGMAPMTGRAGDATPDEESIVTASPDAEQNAEEAAEYWARL